MANLYKKPVFIITLIIVVIVGAAVAQKMLNKNGNDRFDYVVASQGELIQEVSVTGNVKPAESIEMSFEASGTVSNIDVEVGDRVKPGQVIAKLKSTELYADLSQAQANLESKRAMQAQAEASLEAAEIQLADYISGTRSEEIRIAQASVTNAENALTDTQINLTNVENNAEIALADLYSQVDDILHDAYAKADDAVSNQTDVFFKNDFTDNPTLEITLSNNSLKNSAQSQRLYATNSLENLMQTIENLDTTSEESLGSALESASADLAQIRTLLTTLSSALNYVVGESQSTITTYRGYLSTGQTAINTAISNVDSQTRAIATQRATNEYNISTAQSSVTTAQNTLRSAQENLDLKQAGYTDQQIANQQSTVKQSEANLLSQKAQVKQAQANVLSASARLEKMTLKSPIDGIVTGKEVEEGELVASGKTIFTIISEASYQVEANIPEIDIAKINIGDKAIVTLDAYGSDEEFEVTVADIDPAERIIEGVPTYKTTFEFDTDSELVKSGMTANIEIRTGYRENIIAIPQRAIYSDSKSKTVQLLNNDGVTYKEVEIKTGMRGSDGRIEIIEGIKSGDKVIISINDK